MTDDIRVTRDTDRHRWEARVGDTVAGFTTCRLSGGAVDLRHTDAQLLTR